MSTEDRSQVLNLIRKLESNGRVHLADVLRRMMLAAGLGDDLRDGVEQMGQHFGNGAAE